jgi:hypothetical protein
MKESSLSPEVRALLDRERAIPSVPAPVRKRALARARAALVAGRVTVPSSFPGARRTRWGIAIAIACVAGVAVAATAFEIGARHRPLTTSAATAPVAHVVATSPAPATPAATIDAPPSSATAAPAPIAATPSTPAPSNGVSYASQAEPAPDELRLLREARAAVARQDFEAALVPIAEHARRFKNGRLAEEREALRVKALSGLGRTEEARHAADTFEARFPRSVLLPSVSRMPASQP